MIKDVTCFLLIFSVQYCLSSNLQWNLKRPFKYTGIIYTDRNVSVVDPALQIHLNNGEEICNFQLVLASTDPKNKAFNPFRAVVKSAHMGLGEIELKPEYNLQNRSKTSIDLIIRAQACHNPDLWSEPAQLLIKILAPPEPIWTRPSYSATINNDALPGSFVAKVTAYLPKWADPDNKICQYKLDQSMNGSFSIDGSGSIVTGDNLANMEMTSVKIDVIAKDCSQPTSRQSRVAVFVRINPRCQFGWSGFYNLINYGAGFGVSPLWSKPVFDFCSKRSNENLTDLIKECQNKQRFRVTVSVELKSIPRSYTKSKPNDVNICNLDYESLKLQRKICDIDESKMLDLLTILSKQKRGVMKFPQQSTGLPGLSVAVEEKFSLYFWMRRASHEQKSDEFIVCQSDDSAGITFSISITSCDLKIYLHSFGKGSGQFSFHHFNSIGWEFNIEQTCDDRWHNYLLIASKDLNNPHLPDVRLFVDAELVEYKNRGPDIKPIFTIPIPLSEKRTLFIGQCSNEAENKLKGYLAGLVLLPGIVLKSSKVRCLMKCMERLHFNGMNQMNPGMSVSLNSEMQTIIINGHNVDEVGKLLKVIGYTNPKWNPIPGPRKISIQTDISCDKKAFNVSLVEINVNVTRQTSVFSGQQLITSIDLSSNVNSFKISDFHQLHPTTGMGLGIFENATVTISGMPQSTAETFSDDTLTISRCIVTIHPELIPDKEYIEWPQQAIDTFKTDQYSMEVRNSTKKIIFFGEYSQQIYQFIIRHLRLYSSLFPTSDEYSNRKFQLQCSTDVGMSIVNSNTLLVTITYDGIDTSDDTEQSTENYHDRLMSTTSRMESGKRKDQMIEMRAHSDVAKFVETGFNPQISKSAFRESSRIDKNTYKYFLAVGIIILLFSLILMANKIRQIQRQNGCVVSFKVIDYLCFPFQSMKEKIKPNSTVRVELSRDFLHRALSRRIEAGLEMQWDDAEMQPSLKYHIIENPIYEKTDPEFDDNYLNSNVPPTSEKEETSTDDETDDEAYFDPNDRIIAGDKRNKKILIDF